MAKFQYLEDSEVCEVEYALDSSQGRLEVNGESYSCRPQAVESEQQRVPFWVHQEGAQVSVWLDGQVYHFDAHDPRRRSQTGADAGGDGGTVKAQMPGKILQVAVTEGDRVEVGDNLLLMESMKMELALDASVSGIVRVVNVSEQQMVSQGEVLVEIEAEE